MVRLPGGPFRVGEPGVPAASLLQRRQGTQLGLSPPHQGHHRQPVPHRALRGLEGQAPEQPQPHRLPEDREAVQDGRAWAPAEALGVSGSPGGAVVSGRVGEQVRYLIFLFIQRLPNILRMQLGDDLDLDLQRTGEAARLESR
jgi:hypothetical protein